MKILFVNNVLGVKQYHIAAALTDEYNVECHFASLYPEGLNISAGFKHFPNMKKMVSHTLKQRDFITEQVKDDLNNPFHSMNFLPHISLKHSDFDWVYTTRTVDIPDHDNVWLDIEDLTYYDTTNPKDRNRSNLENDQEAIRKSNMITFGSEGEAKKAWDLFYLLGYNFVLYPYVAKRTIPKRLKKKDDDFSLVYAGSIWEGSYRDYFPMIEQILQYSDFEFTVYLSNWRNQYSWNRLKELEKYPNFIAKKAVPFSQLKYEISNFHAGMSFLDTHYRKPQLTYGMKPLEYAYARVQPVSIGGHLIDIGYGEFGYMCSPSTVKEEFKNNLINFNMERNLMDNNLGEIYKNLKRF